MKSIDFVIVKDEQHVVDALYIIGACAVSGGMKPRIKLGLGFRSSVDVNFTGKSCCRFVVLLRLTSEICFHKRSLLPANYL